MRNAKKMYHSQRKPLHTMIIFESLSKGTPWIMNPIISFRITQISDPMNPLSRVDSTDHWSENEFVQRNAIDHKSGSGSSQRNALLSLRGRRQRGKQMMQEWLHASELSEKCERKKDGSLATTLLFSLLPPVICTPKWAVQLVASV